MVFGNKIARDVQIYSRSSGGFRSTPYTVPSNSSLRISVNSSISTEFKAEDQETETGALLNNSAAITIERTPNSRNTFLLIITPKSKYTAYGLRKQQHRKWSIMHHGVHYDSHDKRSSGYLTDR